VFDGSASSSSGGGSISSTIGFSGPKAGSRTHAVGTSDRTQTCVTYEYRCSKLAFSKFTCRYVKLLHVRGLSQCLVGEEDANWCDVVKSPEALSVFQLFESRHR
jgi:hypothetical protein